MNASRSSRLSAGRLPDDFAARVVDRVEQIKHRRSVRRRVVAAAGVLSIVLGLVFVQRHRSISLPAQTIAQQPVVEPEWSSTAASLDEAAAENSAVNLFMPDAYQVTEFTESYGESGWHAYDPWWNSNS